MVDFHLHSTFSIDGMSSMEEHCIQAIEKGIEKICFTEHVDFNIAEYNNGKTKDNRVQNFDVKDYFYEIERLNKKYDKLEILSGVEFSEPHLFQTDYEYYTNLPFDYILASIHHCKNGIFPGKANICEKKAMVEYYELMKESLKMGSCQAIAHIDFPRRYFDSWNIPNNTLEEIFCIMIEKDIALEINTSSLINSGDEPLPNYRVIQKYCEMGGRKVVIGSDAHNCKMLANYFEEVVSKIPQGVILGYFKNRQFFTL